MREMNSVLGCAQEDGARGELGTHASVTTEGVDAAEDQGPGAGGREACGWAYLKTCMEPSSSDSAAPPPPLFFVVKTAGDAAAAPLRSTDGVLPLAGGRGKGRGGGGDEREKKATGMTPEAGNADK